MYALIRILYLSGTSRTPSTAWCLMVKYFYLRLTTRQVNSLIRRKNAPIVRAVGFLYLRVVTDPKKLWDWMEEFINDPEVFVPGVNPDITMTMGKFVFKILTDMHFYDTMLPRIPTQIERKHKVRFNFILSLRVRHDPTFCSGAHDFE